MRCDEGGVKAEIVDWPFHQVHMTSPEKPFYRMVSAGGSPQKTLDPVGGACYFAVQVKRWHGCDKCGEKPILRFIKIYDGLLTPPGSFPLAVSPEKTLYPSPSEMVEKLACNEGFECGSIR